MPVARITEVKGESEKNLEGAIDSALERASETLDQIEGAWVKDIKVTVKDGKVDKYRIALQVTFIVK